jgi:hypothetical protein
VFSYCALKDAGRKDFVAAKVVREIRRQRMDMIVPLRKGESFLVLESTYPLSTNH